MQASGSNPQHGKKKKKVSESIFKCVINEEFSRWVYLNIKFMYVSYPEANFIQYFHVFIFTTICHIGAGV